MKSEHTMHRNHQSRPVTKKAQTQSLAPATTDRRSALAALPEGSHRRESSSKYSLRRSRRAFSRVAFTAAASLTTFLRPLALHPAPLLTAAAAASSPALSSSQPFSSASELLGNPLASHWQKSLP